ncbi:Regulator of microtubule dynamics protein 2 [Nymphon striatum]|nr:Regulator of microtubule dynamics protein 2 [Nymphon striatum]
METAKADKLTLAAVVGAGAVLGAGVVLGVSGIYMYHKLNTNVTHEINHLSNTIGILVKEIEELKSSKLKKYTKKSKRNAFASRNSVGTPSSGEEDFYDFTEYELILNPKLFHLPIFLDPKEGLKEKARSVCLTYCELELNLKFEKYCINDIQMIPLKGRLFLLFFFIFEESPKFIFTRANEENMPFNVGVISTLTDICDRVDRLFNGNSEDKESAYMLLSREFERFSNEPDFLWRLTKATHLYSVKVGLQNDEQKKKLSFEAKEYGTKALELDDTNSEVHKWFAIALGSAGEFLSMQERIKDGFTFKEHIEKAVQLSPGDSTLHHMLGRWCYEVYMLSWIERKVASTLFAAPPEATAEEARSHFQKAEELHCRPWKENKLYIAKTYIGAGEYANAMPWLDTAFSLPVESDDDEVAHREVEILHSKYQGYRT